MQGTWWKAVGVAGMSLLLAGAALAAPLDGNALRGIIREQSVAGQGQGQIAAGGHWMGMIPMSDAELAKSPHIRVKLGARDAQRPTSVILTEYLPPIGDQGHQGSCVGWSTAYYCFGYSVAKKLRLAKDNREQARWQFSPAYIYHLGNGGEDKGMTIGQAFQILTKQGCATLSEMPYSDSDFTTQPGADARKRAECYKAEQTGCFASGDKFGTFKVEEAKVFLATARNPIVLGIPIFRDFPMGAKSPDYIYKFDTNQTKADLLGLHAIAIVGYDDTKHAFRMVNSWGSGWGDQGFLWLDENFLAAGAYDAWSQMPTGPSARSLVLSYEKPAN